MRAAVWLEQVHAPVPGGVGAYVRALADRLPAVAAEVSAEVVGLTAWHRSRLDVAAPIRRIPLPSRPLVAAWQFARFPPLRLFANADIVLAPSLAIPAHGKSPLVVFCADVLWREMPSAYPRWGRMFHDRGLELMAAHARLVLTCSDASARGIVAETGIGRERVRVIPLGAELPVIASDDAAARRTRLGVRRPYVLTVSTLEPRKNIDGVFAALSRLSDRPERLVMTRPGGWQMPALETLAARHRVADRLDLLGFVDEHDKAALYMGAAALCYPSLLEGFGLPVAEAMALGCPVVTSNVSCLPEVAGDAAVTVDPTDHDAIASALRRLFEDEQWRDERIAAGRVQAARFTWDGATRQTWSALEAAASLG